MDLFSLVTEVTDKGIDLLGLIKVTKVELIRLANENIALKAQLVEKDQIIESLKNDKDR